MQRTVAPVTALASAFDDKPRRRRWTRAGVGQLQPGVLPREVSRSRWALGVDAVLTASTAAFAWWTLIYEVALATRSSTTAAILLWLITSPMLGYGIGRATMRAGRAAPIDGDPTNLPSARADLAGSAPPKRSGIAITATCCAAAAAAVVLATQTGAAFTAGWVISLVVVLVIAGRTLREMRTPRLDACRRPVTPSERTHLSEVPALVVSLLMAAVSLFVIRTSSDDAYYVNLSTWVSEHGRFPTGDTMYGNQVYPSSYGGGIPIASIEGLIGSFAGLCHLLAGTVAYLLVVPLCTFASMWVLWRLASLWSPRRPMTSFLCAVAFVIAGTGGAYRSYSLTRIWQGKVIAVAVLIPLIWWLATMLARSRQRHWTVMLAISGIAFVGLTSSVALLGSLVAGCIVCVGVATGNRALVKGGIACGVPAVVSGLVVAMLSSNLGGAVPVAPKRWEALHAAYGAHSAMVALSVLVILLAPLVLSDHFAALLMSSVGIVSLAVLTPGVLQLVDALTGAGAVEWRLLIAPPVPALVGICAAATIARTRRLLPRRASWLATITATAAIGVVFVLVGTPPWQAPITVTHEPSWKVSPPALANVKAVIAAGPTRAGPMLLPQAEMRVLAIYTTHWYAVVPRAADLQGLPEPAPITQARRTLLDLVSSTAAKPAESSVIAALRTLDVGTVCVHPGQTYARRTVRAAGYSPFQPVGTLRCSSSSR